MSVDFTEYDELLGLDIRIECRAHPGRPAKIHGPPEDCHPEEPSEVETLFIVIEYPKAMQGDGPRPTLNPRGINITDMFTADMLERIASDCFQSHIFEPDNDYV